MAHTVLVDGYNAINKIKGLEVLLDMSLEKAREGLIGHLISWKALKGKGVRLAVVFDGSTEHAYASKYSERGVEVYFSDRHLGEDADKKIAKILRQHPGESYTVVSDDNSVANSARAYKARIMPVSFLNIESRGTIVRGGQKTEDRWQKKANSEKLPVSAARKITDDLINEWVLKKPKKKN